MPHGRDQQEPHEAFATFVDVLATAVDAKKTYTASMDAVTVALVIGRGLLAVAKEIYELRQTIKTGGFYNRSC